MVTLENRIFATYVDEQLLEAKDEGRWSDWFETYVSPLTGEDPIPPRWCSKRPPPCGRGSRFSLPWYRASVSLDKPDAVLEAGTDERDI